MFELDTFKLNVRLVMDSPGQLFAASLIRYFSVFCSLIRCDVSSKNKTGMYEISQIFILSIIEKNTHLSQLTHPTRFTLLDPLTHYRTTSRIA